MGYVRLNFGYHMDQAEVDYILDAIEFVSNYGWLYLPFYTFDKESAEFYAKVDTDHQERNWIGEINYTSGSMVYKNSNAFIDHIDNKSTYADAFEYAKSLLHKSQIAHYLHMKSNLDQRKIIDEDFKHLIFFVFPSEVSQKIEEIHASNKDLEFEDLEQYIYTSGSFK